MKFRNVNQNKFDILSIIIRTFFTFVNQSPVLIDFFEVSKKSKARKIDESKVNFHFRNVSAQNLWAKTFNTRSFRSLLYYLCHPNLLHNFLIHKYLVETKARIQRKSYYSRRKLGEHPHYSGENLAILKFLDGL